LFFFSGIFFPVEKQILPIKIIAYAFPLANGVKLSQNIFWAVPFSQESWLHVMALLIQCLVFGGVAFWRIKKLLQN
jgi:ABC-type polysaccharide/polyol phosphate export permease